MNKNKFKINKTKYNLLQKVHQKKCISWNNLMKKISKYKLQLLFY